jgi:tetratricopeptide (TPR) repeat protein/predicted Ser/Thr protein kinase
MTAERRERAWAVFDQLADVPAEQREAALQAACGDDLALRAEVEELLACDARLTVAEGEQGFLQSPLVRPPGKPDLSTSPVPPAEGKPRLPERVGRYRVLRLLGEGGMGAVYEAQQDNPRRTVALKVIRPGLLSPALLKRFAYEAHILGLLHHPGIAQIYDAGVAEDGQPFFAMELIRGLPLDEYARLRSLTLPARLELLARVADAVQHAHEQGVIHRDLKPANILVDEAGQPRVLDFGVARVTGADLLTSAERTRTGQLIGTLSYMSPEQVAADPTALDARSDVYALGVILFELLAGRLPYRLEGLTLPAAARLIREQEPARLGALEPRLRGDVETIVARALEKEPPRRYPSAAELAEDVRRHLWHEPIRARPPSALYQLGKFARRHKALVVATAAFLVVLLAAGAVAGWQALRLARTERDRAVAQARRGQQVQEALGRAALLREQARSAAGDLGKWAEARALARRAEGLAQGGPVEPGLAERVAALLRELGEEEKDRQMIAELDGVRLRQAEVTEWRSDTPGSSPRYAEAFRRYGLDVEALPAAEAARRVRGSAIREELLAALDQWAWSHEKGPRREKLWDVAGGADDNPWRRALRGAARRADRARLKELAADARALEQPPVVLALLGEALQGVGLPGEAVVFLRQAQQRHPEDFWINHNLGRVLAHQVQPPRPEQALGYFRAALALRPRSQGTHVNLGIMLLTLGDLPGAAACFRRALELDPQFFEAHGHLGVVLRKQGDLAGAAARHRKALELRPNDPRAYNYLGATKVAQGDLPGAAACFRRALALEPKDALAHYNLGNTLVFQGDLAGADAAFRHALRIDPKYAEAHCNLGQVLLEQGDLRAALAELQTGHALGSRRNGWSYPSDQWVKRCERFLELDRRLPAILKGAAVPAAAERRELAELCHYKRLHATAVRFFTEAFAADAKLADDFLGRSSYRYLAACSAAQAGCGQGEEAARPDEAERARLRRQALEWLRADLASHASRLKAAPQGRDSAVHRATLLAVLGCWQNDPALAGVRDATSLARLPAAERAGWQKLWADAAAKALARATK